MIAVIWGSVLLRSGEVDLESWLAFFLFVPMVNSALRNLAAMWGDFKAVQGRAALIRAMVDAPQEQDGVSENIPAGDVEFQNVCFGYVEDEEILEASIPKGETGKNMIRTTGTIRLTAGHRFWILLATPQTLPIPKTSICSSGSFSYTYPTAHYLHLLLPLYMVILQLPYPFLQQCN